MSAFDAQGTSPVETPDISAQESGYKNPKHIVITYHSYFVPEEMWVLEGFSLPEESLAFSEGEFGTEGHSPRCNKCLPRETQNSPRETKNPAKTHFPKHECDFSHLSFLPNVTWKRGFLALAGQENAKPCPSAKKVIWKQQNPAAA
jgi:hypothetical protein